MELTVQAVGEDDERVAFHQIELAECELISERPREALSLLRRAEAIYDAGDRTSPDRRSRLAMRLSQAVFFAHEGDQPHAEAVGLASRATQLHAQAAGGVARPELVQWVQSLAETTVPE